jgi:hypothetical protein
MLPKLNAHLGPRLQAPEESRVELFPPEPSSSSLSTVARSVELTKKLKYATSTADTIVSGVLGVLMVASFLAVLLQTLLDKTDKNIPAKFNTSSSMEELLVPEIHQNMTAPVLIWRTFPPVVLAVQKALGVLGLHAL